MAVTPFVEKDTVRSKSRSRSLNRELFTTLELIECGLP